MKTVCATECNNDRVPLSPLPPRVRRWVGCVPLHTSAYFWRNFDLRTPPRPPPPRYFNWAKINRVGNGRARSRYFSTLASAGNRARILEYRDSCRRTRMFLDDEKVEKCDFLCFFFFFIQVLYFILILARPSNRSIFGSVPKVGRIRSEMDWVWNVRASEWVSEMWWKMFGGKVISTFFDSCFVWILPSFKLYRIFCATIINHISIRFHSLEILFREYTLYIHFRRISVFLLVSRWTGHAVPVVKSSWREKEETRSERGYMGREIASGRPSAAEVSSFFDSLNGKLKRFVNIAWFETEPIPSIITSSRSESTNEKNSPSKKTKREKDVTMVLENDECNEW